MKKSLCLLLALFLSIALCGCSMLEEYLPDLEGVFEGGSLDFGGNGASSVEDILGLPDAEEDDADNEEQEGAQEQVREEDEPEGIMLPHFEYQPLDYAIEWLIEVGFEAQIEYAYSSEIAEGFIISQNIAAGTQVSSEDTLILTVSEGTGECPYEYSQKLTVTAPKGATTGKATLYEWENGDWQQVAVYNASLGKNGIGEAAEGSRRTPQGIHRLGVVLTEKTVSTNMPVYHVAHNTCVVDDKTSGYYNIIMATPHVPSGTSYDQIGKSLTNGTTYATIFIEHNGDGFSSEGVVPGKGSAIGVRGQYGALKATYGDVDISYRDMQDLLSRLDAQKNPVIEIVLQ